MLLVRKILNNKWQLLLLHLRVSYMVGIQKVCSEVNTDQLTRKQLKWMLDGFDRRYFQVTQDLYNDFCKLYK